MAASILRTAHHRRGDDARLLVAERPPLDELGDASANAETTARGLAAAEQRGRPFEPKNGAARGRPPNLARLGVDLESADPKYRAAMKRASRFMAHRRRELAVAGGGHVSAGVCAILAAGARALAGSTLLHEMASELLASGNAKSRRLAADLIVKSARLGDAHRQAELTALALHERETAARPPSANDVPWLVAAPEPTTKAASSPETTTPALDAVDLSVAGDDEHGDDGESG